MGQTNPDRVPLLARRRRCETVADMIRERWDVISVCDRCGLMMTVSLKVIAAVRGRDLSLWNQHARCRRIGCSGWVDFRAKAPGMVMHEDLKGRGPGD